MDKFIRKNATFNTKNPRDMRIYNWILSETNEFKDIRFTDFVRNNLEQCMKGETHETKNSGGWGDFT